MTTGSQTVGPFFSIGLEHLFSEGADGVTLSGTLTDGAGVPIPDAFLEFWAPGGADESSATRFRRVPTGPDGRYEVGLPLLEGANGTHYVVLLFMRGLLRHLLTRVYVQAASDDVLEQVPVVRRATLLARSEADRQLVWDIHMQGELETVFFDW